MSNGEGGQRKGRKSSKLPVLPLEIQRKKTEIEEYLDSMEEYEQKPRTSLTLQEYLPDKVLNGEINEESMKKYLPEEIVDMLLEEWGKEEDEDTPTATCRCISHTPGESPSDMIADIVAATTEFIPEEDEGMNVDESLNFDIRTPPDVEIPQDITEFVGTHPLPEYIPETPLPEEMIPFLPEYTPTYTGGVDSFRGQFLRRDNFHAFCC